MTAESLKGYTLKDLAQLAKKRRVAGWHSMKKEELVRALVKAARTKSAKKSAARPKAEAARHSHHAANGSRSTQSRNGNGSTRASSNGSRNHAAARVKRPSVVRRLEQAKAQQDRNKNLSTTEPAHGAAARDRLVVMVRDPFWLHAYWELTRQSVERAKAAMGADWHTARPVLRLIEVANNNTTSATELVSRDIEIHGGVNNWYVDVKDPPKSYRLDIGYLASSGRFFLLARSNIVSTPKAGASDSLDENWSHVAENFEKIYAMSGGNSEAGNSLELQELFEERLRRPMGAPIASRLGAALNGFEKKPDFFFELDAELIVYGSTEPGARVTLQGDPVRLRGDGTFTVRFSMPNCRQVIPAVAASADGLEQRTVVLAVERNTKTLEPVVRDSNE